MTSPNAMFTEAVANFTKSIILDHLSTWLKQHKNVEVSPDELAKALDLPIDVTPRLVGGLQSVPSALAGTTSNPRAPATKKVAGDPNRPCQYLFNRGVKKGTICGKPSTPGTDYCSTCHKKDSVKKLLSAGVGTSQPGVASRPTTVAKPVNVPTAVEPFEDGTYLDREDGFVLKCPEDGVVIAIAMYEDGQQRPLTSDEEQRAMDKGYSLPVNSTPTTTIQTTEQPRVMSLPTANPLINRQPTIPRPKSVAPTIPTLPKINVPPVFNKA